MRVANRDKTARNGTVERGRVASWSREQIDSLSTLEVRQLLVNAERLQETEVAAICNALLDERPRGRAPVRKPKVKIAVIKSAA
jgi:hypothetical protein